MGNETPKISVIIPINNNKKYIRACLESVLLQNLQEIEVICVNYGSADGSIDIISDIAWSDDRLRIITPDDPFINGAIYTGVKEAQGEYISFIEPKDQYYNFKTLEILYNKAIENDVLICGGNYGIISEDPLKNIEINSTDDIYNFFENKLYDYSEYRSELDFHRFIYNRRLIIDDKLLLQSGYQFKDNVWFVKVLNKAGRFFGISEKVYSYRIKQDCMVSGKEKHSQINTDVSNLTIQNSCDPILSRNDQIKATSDLEYSLFKTDNYYFVIDSSDLESVRSNLYGYCILDGHIVSDYKKLHGRIPDGDGFYVIVEREDATINIFQDLLGSYGLYLFESNGYWAISNNFLYLMDYLKTDHKLTFNKSYADVFLIDYMTSYIYGETMVNEIKWLDRRVSISIDISSKQIHTGINGHKEKTIPIDTREGMDILDSWYEKWVSIIRNTLSDFSRCPRQSLSGGFDSRMVLSLFMDECIDRSRVDFYSINDDKRNHAEDFRIATAISEMYGFQLNKEFNIEKEKRTLSLKDLLAKTVYTKMGFHKQFQWYSEIDNPLRIFFDGHGGESLRDVWHYTSLDEFINKLFEKRAHSNNLSGQLAPLAESATKKVRQSSKDLCNLYKSEYDSKIPTSESFLLFINVRNRIHAGMSNTGMHTIHLKPLMDAALLQIKNDGNFGDHDLLAAVILSRYAPELVDIPIEGGRYIADQTKEYAKKLCLQYPIKKNCINNNYIDEASSGYPFDSSNKYDQLGSLYGITQEMWDKAKSNPKITGKDAEGIIQHAFMSSRIRKSFISIYGEKLYDAIIQSPAKIAWHPFQHFYAGLAIGVINYNCENSGSGKTGLDVIDLIISCAEENG